MTPTLFLAQRLTAAILAVAVVVHLATIVYAVQGGLSAGEILARTRGNAGLLAFYSAFVLAAAVHGPIGLRAVLREWLGLKGFATDAAMLFLAALFVVLGLRAAWGLYAA